MPSPFSVDAAEAVSAEPRPLDQVTILSHSDLPVGLTSYETPDQVTAAPVLFGICPSSVKSFLAFRCTM